MVASTTYHPIADWWPLFEARAKKFSGLGGAEFDDLVQEGAINGWLSLERGYLPRPENIDNALRDYIKGWSHRGQTN